MRFVQHLHEEIVREEFDDHMIIRDSRPAPCLHHDACAACPYCDNLGVIGCDPVAVLRLRESVHQAFLRIGFHMHEEAAAEDAGAGEGH